MVDCPSEEPGFLRIWVVVLLRSREGEDICEKATFDIVIVTRNMVGVGTPTGKSFETPYSECEHNRSLST